MAEERTLGLARAPEYMSEEPSKEELQRRMGEARDSISNTVTEIKETVANQVQAVKDTLDWREQFKRRPVAWSAAALGVGFATGYCIANYAKGDEESRPYGGAAMAAPAQAVRSPANGSHESGPSFFQKVAHTSAFERVRDEAGNIGDAVVQELSKTAKNVVLPALIMSLRNFIGDHLPNADKTDRQNDMRGSAI
ncbi:MAG TPA: hypothetical protein VFI24_25485 [Pyrinomonadaceae bacterium]|nr:hypothetical protein [Pyrinomonadaceae bacterium]